MVPEELVGYITLCYLGKLPSASHSLILLLAVLIPKEYHFQSDNSYSHDLKDTIFKLMLDHLITHFDYRQ